MTNKNKEHCEVLNVTQRTSTAWKESHSSSSLSISHLCCPAVLLSTPVPTSWPWTGPAVAQQCLSLARYVCTLTLTVECRCRVVVDGKKGGKFFVTGDGEGLCDGRRGGTKRTRNWPWSIRIRIRCWVDPSFLISLFCLVDLLHLFICLSSLSLSITLPGHYWFLTRVLLL